ncbi:hypothetical protein HDU76_007027, partial [Blyttiomyces sp. JEL0837]
MWGSSKSSSAVLSSSPTATVTPPTTTTAAATPTPTPITLKTWPPNFIDTDPDTTTIYTLSLPPHDPIFEAKLQPPVFNTSFKEIIIPRYMARVKKWDAEVKTKWFEWKDQTKLILPDEAFSLLIKNKGFDERSISRFVYDQVLDSSSDEQTTVSNKTIKSSSSNVKKPKTKTESYVMRLDISQPTHEYKYFKEYIHNGNWTIHMDHRYGNYTNFDNPKSRAKSLKELLKNW